MQGDEVRRKQFCSFVFDILIWGVLGDLMSLFWANFGREFYLVMS